MPTYTITLSDAEDKALSYVAYSQQDWIDNAAHERCRVAIEEISRICVDKCLEEGIQVPASREAMVDLAFTKGWVVAAANRPAIVMGPAQ